MRQSGFTLLEVLLAAFILAVVFSTVFAAYHGTFRLAQDTLAGNEMHGMARTALERMTRDLESACSYGGAYRFVLSSREVERSVFPVLSFHSGSGLDLSGRGMPAWTTHIRYHVEKDDADGYVLMRTDASTAAGFAVCGKLHSLNFTLTDSEGRSSDSWDSESDKEGRRGKIPALVQIDLKLDSGRPDRRPYHFMTRARIGAAQTEAK
ncbi:MAG: prepilin-type N-terminal cleavage/methylation domain-containing protein [Syntrophales bacterium]|nr:prepilin-type N-terminal cleavage/methylation domain-containing protein [Syntrophales bacterium]MDD5233138.1 prepilin-type N-terminal cleavage/methylation domain-containing protein [Syntrophales bacterium]MDD5531324.1 prepilin-type N-terminal cleavage/methylation domain-containing protein [Syntrophales bacterium]HPL63483.1 prepilin-type N-terminal cleavage/methylation domain-containing protein [Syntrophales bacterium]